MKTKKLTIQQLYDRVWAEPIQRLSKDFGLSDVGLAKLCRRHDVPVPGRGYWRRKQTGHKVKQTPLPRSANPEQVVLVRGSEAHEPEPMEPLHPLIAFERQAENLVVVSPHIRATHPLVRSTREYWVAMRHRDPRATVPLPPHLNVGVSRGQRPRALRIMHALLVALEARGFGVSASPEGRTRIQILGETLELSISERSRQQCRELTKAEQEDKRRGFLVRPYDVVPSGVLALRIENTWGGRSSWTDGQRDRLEARLNDVVEGLVTAALRMQQRRIEREREEQRRRDEEERRKAAQRAELEEELRIRGFERLVNAWIRSQNRRALLAKLHDAVGEVDRDSEFGKWLAWADEYVAKADVGQRVLRWAEPLPVYYTGYDADSAVASGFEQSLPTGYAQEKFEPGIVVWAWPRQAGHYQKTASIQLTEGILLGFDWTGPESDDRVFRVPASLLNRASRRLVCDE